MIVLFAEGVEGAARKRTDIENYPGLFFDFLMLGSRWEVLMYFFFQGPARNPEISMNRVRQV